ncbi:nuclear transport factor 2 family protein [Cellvibrio sp.]|uniref:nuclear transport factor 2 family protein n=1 Tax=Cellvibrio sp. TaxID=1965322 RepID=UPI003964889E
MSKLLLKIIGFSALCLSLHSVAQVAVTANSDHAAMLASKDPKLAANKKLVYDFWREVFEGGHLELAPQYMTETYIQHNPTVATGRKAFVDFFGQFKKPQAIADKVKAPLVSITAEGDIVTLTFVREQKDPKDPTKTYTTTWFDMFRIEDGKIAEHWDPMTKAN